MKHHFKYCSVPHILAYVEANKRKRVYEVLLKFALKSLNQYGPKESLIFLMLIAQLCTGKDILYDNVVLLRGVVSSHLGSATEEKSETKGLYFYINFA